MVSGKKKETEEQEEGAAGGEGGKTKKHILWVKFVLQMLKWEGLSRMFFDPIDSYNFPSGNLDW